MHSNIPITETKQILADIKEHNLIDTQIIIDTHKFVCHHKTELFHQKLMVVFDYNLSILVILLRQRGCLT
jgi:hypothetical protein